MERYSVKVEANGGMVIPDRVRSMLGLTDGGDIVLKVENGAVRIETLDNAVKRAQALVAPYVPRDISLVDELIADRRAASDD